MTREEAIEKLESMRQKVDEETYRALILAIKALEQKSKTGHWVISPNDCFAHCSECGLHGDKGIYKHYRWCPNCGARMESEK